MNTKATVRRLLEAVPSSRQYVVAKGNLSRGNATLFSAKTLSNQQGKSLLELAQEEAAKYDSLFLGPRKTSVADGVPEPNAINFWPSEEDVVMVIGDKSEYFNNPANLLSVIECHPEG